jgi:precorrin-2 dehydrogenase / sirohydrochlorin ferrochelatase
MGTDEAYMRGREMELFPIVVKLEGRRCVVVGAGEIAASKTSTLLGCGARVTVIAPRASESIQKWAREEKLTWLQRDFVPGDLEGALLVVAATNSQQVNEQVFRTGHQSGVLCNVVDDPERCDFYYPAVVQRGALQIAISTGGNSPALAHRLRVELEQQFGPEYESWVEEVGRRRREIMARDLPEARRRELLEKIASREHYDEFVRGRATGTTKTTASLASTDPEVGLLDEP